MKVVVSNTGPILHLGEAKILDFLGKTGEVHIPKIVEIEVVRHNAAWYTEKPSWIIVDRLVSPYTTEAMAWQQAGLLDSGEAETVALAKQLNAHWLFTDDTAARLVAKSLGLEVHGSLGIVLWVAAKGYITRLEAEGYLNCLAYSTTLWISPRVLTEAKAALDKLFP